MITQEVIDQMRAEYAAGMKISKIKVKYKLHEMALAELYRKPGKLKDVELRKRVIERYKQLQSYAEVAREFGVSRQNVYALIQRTIKDSKETE